MVNLFIVYELDTWSQNLDSDFTLANCLFGEVNMTKNADPDKYKYSGYDIGFDSCSLFSCKSDCSKNVIIFGADMTSSVHTNNKTRNILVLGQVITELNDKKLTAEANYSTNFSKINTKFCLSLHYNGADSYIFVNATEIIRFKAKNSGLKASPLCLGNLSKSYSASDTIKTGLKESEVCTSFLLVMMLLILVILSIFTSS